MPGGHRSILARRQRFARVLDLGCGTALLGIAAARVLPNARVIASDNDPDRHGGRAGERPPEPRRGARARARRNRASVIRLLRAPRAFDLILANILPGPLIELAPDMRRALRSGGIAVLCGLLSHQAREVRGVYLARGVPAARRAVRGGMDGARGRAGVGILPLPALTHLSSRTARGEGR